MAATTLSTPAPGRFQARLAFRLLRELIRDPSDTDKVFAFFEAVGGDDGPRHFAQFAADPAAERLLAARPSLVAALSNEAYLSSLPDDSFGTWYLRFIRSRGFTPAGLLEARERGAGRRIEDVPEREWFYDRINVMHDLWHVLTGYGTDEPGGRAGQPHRPRLENEAGVARCSEMRVHGMGFRRRQHSSNSSGSIGDRPRDRCNRRATGVFGRAATKCPSVTFRLSVKNSSDNASRCTRSLGTVREKSRSGTMARASAASVATVTPVPFPSRSGMYRHGNHAGGARYRPLTSLSRRA